MNKVIPGIRFLTVVVIYMISVNGLSAQDRYQNLQNRLNSMIADIPAIDDKINVSVTDVSIQEFISIISDNTNLNIYIDPEIKQRITGNYSQVRVMDILMFLCKEYNLDIRETGSILSLVRYEEPVAAKPITVRKEPRIDYKAGNDLLSLDLKGDSLFYVVRKLTDITQKNVIISPELENMLVSVYIKNTPFDAAIEKLAYTNKMAVTVTKDNFYILEKPEPANGKNTAAASGLSSLKKNDTESVGGTIDIVFDSPTSFSVQGHNVPLKDLLIGVSDTLGINYSIIDELEGEAAVHLNNVDYEEFLNRIFIDGLYGYQSLNGFFLVGKNDNPMLRSPKVIKLQHRTVEKIMTYVPEDLTKNLVVNEFTEQNSLIVVGNPFQVQKFEAFISQIDQVVPLVLIELLIVEVNKTRSVSTGINAGINADRAAGNKIVSPGIDYDISSETINSVLEKMNTIGWINFGRVNPNFYLSIKALENDGKIIIRSTPKLATLNGHEASLSSGETKYYKEERSNIIGTQNPTLSNSYTWTAIKADLSVIIKPIVSGNEQITLEITVDQSQFTPREYENSPPGSVTRNFKSLIRMKNQEMVLLGGLDKFSTTNTSAGIPFIARIPVLKWIFGSNSREKTDTKLNLFIQPTIIY